jgi:hypothetical protein
MPALPLVAIARPEIAEAGGSSLHDWLESLKPGWALRFTIAFERAGLTELRKLATLQGSDYDLLEDELRTQGARIVQLKQIRKAINALANAEKTPQHVTPKCCIPKEFESPMAIYFGESYPNLFDHFSAPLPRKDVYEGMSPCIHSGTLDAHTCKSPEANVTIAYSPPGLPYKSPMAAFFDGDLNVELGDFYLSPQRSSPADSAVLSEETAGCCKEKPTALQRKPSRKASRVSWADDLEKKAALPLVELIDAPTSKKESSLAQCVWELSRDPEGTFEVQRAIEEGSEDERLAVAFQLRGHIHEATQCPHANHVLRKVITTMSPPTLNFVVLELLSVGEAGILDIARHRYGCRIIEGLLTHFDTDRLGYLVKYLMKDALSLCTHMYGNFVIQRILETTGLHGLELLRETVQSHLRIIGTNFYGCAVVGKILRHSDDVERLRLARAIISVNGLLAAMGRHRLGKETVELVLAQMHGPDRAAAESQLAAPLLKVSKRGRTH